MQTRLLALLALLTICAVPASAVPLLYTQGRTYNVSDHIVSASVFHWYTSTDGQLSGPWLPLDGRPNWTGTSTWWKSQIKQMMMANIDVMWVHLIPYWDSERTNLFIALNQLRALGYDVPKVAPFLDPMITWDQQPLVDLATTSGKDQFVSHYIRFFQEYYSANTDAHADTYIERIGGKVVLDTWHVKWNTSNLSSLTRADVESRLAAAFGQAHPVFNSGIRMVTTAFNTPTLSFADEKVPQFEVTQYYRESLFNGVRAVQLKGGYWDQNVRNPGSILKRNGGSNYKSSWNSVNRSTTSRVYIESWNEYDEGSGIYAAVTGAPYILPGSGNTNTDVWSSTNDPYEYIHTTATGAAAFNDTPDLGAKILWQEIPTSMRGGATLSARVIVRNEGDLSWNGALGVKFSQNRSADPAVFAASDCAIVDTANEIPTYGGIFRGRPIEFSVQMTAPATPGTYVTHWGMADSGGARFGDQVPVTITVSPAVPVPGTPTDAGVATRTTTLRFDWTGVTDPVSGTAGYNCRVGTTPGGSNVFNGYVTNALYKTVVGTNGQTYYCQVQAVANDGGTSAWSASSDGILVDTASPQAPGIPVDAGLYTRSGTITFTWAPAYDAGSGVVDYICQIGTAPYGTDVFIGFVGNVLSKSVDVAAGRTCYCRVAAKDAVGNIVTWSGMSDGVGVVDAADVPVGSAKALGDGKWIGLTLPVSAAFNGFFYVQDPAGASGIRVLSSDQVQVGSLVRLYGGLITVNGERVISAVKVSGT